MTPAVHQLLAVFSRGDAIGNAALRTQAILRRLGYRSEIFANAIDEHLTRQARPAAMAANLGQDDALIYHLSIGSPAAEIFRRTSARRIIVYHNITPPSYYEGINERVTYWLERGLHDLRELVPLADLCIGDSTFNAEELASRGARRCAVIPPPVDLERLHPRPATPGQPPRVLFVGRLARNKRQEDLIRALAALRATAIPDARLVLAGTGTDTAPYVDALRALSQRLDVADAVEIPAQRLDDDVIAGYYRSAAVFACSSEHEGFCIPLIEAMAFSLPIVAYAAAAIPETLDGAGVLVDHKDPLVWAALLARLIEDEKLRCSLTSAGRERVELFGDSHIAARLSEALSAIGLAP